MMKNITNEIFFIEDVPLLSFNPHHYVDKRINNYQMKVLSHECKFYEYNLIKKYINKNYLSFINIICPNLLCSLLIENKLMYIDNFHLSFEFTDLKKDKILNQFKNRFLIKHLDDVKLPNKQFLLYYLNNSIICG